jgi:3-oxoacyl-[acyl-carrier protein] reductase
MTTPDSTRRIALVNDARRYVGPELARMLARRNHDLVLGEPEPSLVAELESLGSTVLAVEKVANISRPENAQKLVDAAIERFGRFDAAVAFSGQIIPGSFLDSTIDQLEHIVEGCLYGPYYFLKAVIPPLVAQGSGQVLVITSAAGARPTPGASLYSSVRAGATMLTRNVAGEVARKNVQVNAVGTNFMDFPEFLEATGAKDPAVREMFEKQVPMRRLGRMDEFAAFCAPFLDGTSTFTTGQYVSYAGGWV